MESQEKLLSKQERIVAEIQNKSETLNNEHIASIDLLLSENEIDALNKFNLPEEYGNLSFDYYGESEAELVKSHQLTLVASIMAIESPDSLSKEIKLCLH